MRTLTYLLPVLACPLGMAVMMWFMMRGRHENPTRPAANVRDEELGRLRAELDELRRRQHARR